MRSPVRAIQQAAGTCYVAGFLEPVGITVSTFPSGDDGGRRFGRGSQRRPSEDPDSGL